MTVGEEVVIGSHVGGITVFGGAMNRNVFAKGVMVANFGPGDTALPFQILSLETDAGERIDLVAFSQLCMAVDDNVGMKPATGAQLHVLTDHTIGTNFATVTDTSFGMDDRSGMNHEEFMIY